MVRVVWGIERGGEEGAAVLYCGRRSVETRWTYESSWKVERPASVTGLGGLAFRVTPPENQSQPAEKSPIAHPSAEFVPRPTWHVDLRDLRACPSRSVTLV